MKAIGDVCTCGNTESPEKENKGGLCPVCGKRINKVEDLSDSLIDATFEILAEEGAIWSGAR
jgi:hypothetical protein